MVAIALGLQHSPYVDSLVLRSGYYYPTPCRDAVLLSPPALPLVGDLMRYTVLSLIGRLIWPAMVRILFGLTDTTRSY